jgi:hypothetical protein
MGFLELTEDKGVVFAGETTQELEGDDEEDYADARACEHAFGGDAPRR